MPQSFVKTVAQGGAAMVAATPPGRWLATCGGRLPCALKAANVARGMSAIARRVDGLEALIETNGGIADNLRLLIPSGKSDLLYGRPDQQLSERATLALAMALARGSRTFVDIGANEGIFTFSIAHMLGAARHAQIHAFEPDPELFGRLQTNLDRNAITVQLSNAAVGNHIGMQTFHRNLDDDSSGSLTTFFSQTHRTSAIQMQVTTLTNYLEVHALEQVCVKVDVEGAGAAVWDGARAGQRRLKWMLVEIIGPELEAKLPERIIAETGWNAFYIRDFDLVRSKGGEYEYVAPFYNWLFCPAAANDLAALLENTRFRVLQSERAI